LKYSEDKIILGIDPGTNLLGYGIIHATKPKAKLILSGVLDMKKINDPYLKLQRIFNRITQLIDEYMPDELAIESQFFGKNIQSMLKLGRAQGVAISAALQRDIPIFEYAPRKIKLAVTGTGTASKEQLAGIVENYFGKTDFKKSFDETDALSIALCHYFESNSIISKLPTQKRTKISTSSSKSWEHFVNSNPHRVKK
jgi:crossover junction endodeoxyribonuclease RuvC